MALSIIPYTKQWIPAVKEFNARLAAHAGDFRCRWGREISNGLQFPEVAESLWLPKTRNPELFDAMRHRWWWPQPCNSWLRQASIW